MLDEMQKDFKDKSDRQSKLYEEYRQRLLEHAKRG
jgi:septin family protein